MLSKWHYVIQVLLLVRSMKSDNAPANNPDCPYNSTTLLEPLDSWSYRGCYTDNSRNRLLNSTSYNGLGNNTVLNCADFCGGYNIFGVENSAECYCSNSFNTASNTDLSNDINCHFACCADPTISCGGFWYISIYERIEPASSRSAILTSLSPTQTSSTVDNGVSNSNAKSLMTPSSTLISNNNDNSNSTLPPTQTSIMVNDNGGNSNATTAINPSGSRDLGLGAKVGIGVSCAIGGLSALAAVACFLVRSKSREQKTSSEPHRREDRNDIVYPKAELNNESTRNELPEALLQELPGERQLHEFPGERQLHEFPGQ